MRSTPKAKKTSSKTKPVKKAQRQTATPAKRTRPAPTGPRLSKAAARAIASAFTTQDTTYRIWNQLRDAFPDTDWDALVLGIVGEAHPRDSDGFALAAEEVAHFLSPRVANTIYRKCERVRVRQERERLAAIEAAKTPEQRAAEKAEAEAKARAAEQQEREERVRRDSLDRFAFLVEAVLDSTKGKVMFESRLAAYLQANATPIHAEGARVVLRALEQAGYIERDHQATGTLVKMVPPSTRRNIAPNVALADLFPSDDWEHVVTIAQTLPLQWGPGDIRAPPTAQDVERAVLEALPLGSAPMPTRDLLKTVMYRTGADKVMAASAVLGLTSAGVLQHQEIDGTSYRERTGLLSRTAPEGGATGGT